MKKILTITLIISMIITITACGGSSYDRAASEISRISGQKVTAADVKESIKQMEKMTGKKIKPEELVEFYKDMSSLADGLTGDGGSFWDSGSGSHEEWPPLKDIPKWAESEAVSWNNYQNEDHYSILAGGSEEVLSDWIKALEDKGFKGFNAGYEAEYHTKNCSIYIDEHENSDDYNYYITIETNRENEIGFPDELKGVMPEYSGDGVLFCVDTYEESEDEIYYTFSVVGESDEGALRYIDTLLKEGFTEEDAEYYNPPWGHYQKTEGGKKYMYMAEEYWYEYNSETGTGIADFSVFVKKE